jgi:hypothetical protein
MAEFIRGGKGKISLHGCSADRPHHQNNNKNRVTNNYTDLIKYNNELIVK